MGNEYISSIYEKNRQSSKKCSLCVYYVSSYKDEDNVLRSACRFANSYGHVSHNPAATCSDYKEDKQFTLQEFIEQDVCFMVSDELISDDFDDIWEWIYNDTDYLQDLSEKEILDKYSHVKLYKKEFAKCPAEIVDDYLKDNFYIESAALKSIPELIEVRTHIQNFNETQNWYIKGAYVGWIDLSEIIKEYMKDEVQ